MEQNIYTYCFQRFNKPGGGYGTYSCSDGFEQCFENEDIMESICQSYVSPTNSDVWMSVSNMDIKQEEEKIKQFHPEKFRYQIVHMNGTDYTLLSYGKNLGRETTGFRVGNVVVYTLIGSPSEIEDYPCFYAQDEDFARFSRDFFMRDPDDPKKIMDPLSSNAKCAKPLPSKKVIPGNTVTRESVHQFLMDEPNSDEILTQLFYSLINERSGNKRTIVICDDKNKIAYWIAAVTLLFPLPTAKKISFSTYEYSVAMANLSNSDKLQLCGVYSSSANGLPDEKTTEYSYNELKDNSNIVLFDIEKDHIPEYEKDGFSDVIARFCRGDESLLKLYHNFLVSDTSYSDYDMFYTRFYPISSVNTELFSYYNRSTQENIVNEYYPFIYEVNVDDEDLKKAEEVISEAFRHGVIDAGQLKEDLREYTRRVIRDGSSEDIALISRNEGIMKLVELDSKQTVKDCLRNDILVQGVEASPDMFTPQKAGALLKMYDTNDIYLETNSVNYLVNVLTKSQIGEGILSVLVIRWLENGMKNWKTALKPDTVVVLLKLDRKNKDRHISFIIRELMSCDKKYQRDVLEALLKSEFSKGVFDELQKNLWSGTYSYSRSYDYVTVLKSIDLELGNRLNDAFMEHLENDMISVQKNVVEEFIENPKLLFNNYWDRLVKKIYRQYPFNNEDEIALFTYKYYKKAIQQNIMNYKEGDILFALKKCDCSDKKWRKAVDRAAMIGDDKQIDAKIREMMKDIIKADAAEGYISGGESDKKGKIWSFFDSFKNKFRK